MSELLIKKNLLGDGITYFCAFGPTSRFCSNLIKAFIFISSLIIDRLYCHSVSSMTITFQKFQLLEVWLCKIFWRDSRRLGVTCIPSVDSILGADTGGMTKDKDDSVWYWIYPILSQDWPPFYWKKKKIHPSAIINEGYMMIISLFRNVTQLFLFNKINKVYGF